MRISWLSAEEITAELNARFSTIQEGFTFAFMPPAIQGLGNGSGWSLFVEDRTRLGYGELQNAVQAFQGAASQVPGMGFPISSYQANVPQLDAEVDRVQAKAQGVPLTELFETLQTYLICSQDEPRAWVWSRQGDGSWPSLPTKMVGRDGSIALSGLGVELAMAAICRGIPDAPTVG